jgi:hypothetical protein
MSKRDSRWLYYKIYTAAGVIHLEHLIAQTLPAVLECPGIGRWFFLRYLDEEGPHLRLRIRTTGHSAGLDHAVTPLLARGLDQLSEVPPLEHCPTVMLPQPPNPSLAAPVMGIRRDRYRPEVGKFGVHGIYIAEALFEASSRIAVQIIIDERAGEYSRKDIVPLLMKSVQDAFAHQGDTSAFWERYASYWLSTIAKSEELRQRFVEKRSELAARGITVLGRQDRLATGAATCLAQWRLALEKAVDEYSRVPDVPAVPMADLAFHFVHLMNNRLGVMPVEESYFGVLLAARNQPLSPAEHH